MRNPRRPAIGVRGLLGLLLASGAAFSCGGDGDGAAASCQNFMACGGTVTGNWQAQQTCPPPAQTLLPSCPASKIDFSGVKATGAVNLNADMTFTRNLAFGGNAKITLPKSCFAQLAQIPCESLGALLPLVQTQIMVDIDIPGTLSCKGTDVCDCTLALDPNRAKNMSSGTYAVASDKLVLTESTGDVSSFDYCATANTLAVKPTPSGSAGGAPANPTDFATLGLAFSKK